MQHTQHRKHDHDDAGTHGIGAGGPAVIIQHDNLDGRQMNRGGNQEDNGADGGHGTHEKIRKILNKSHPGQRKNYLEKGAQGIAAKADGRLFDGRVNIFQI